MGRRSRDLWFRILIASLAALYALTCWMPTSAQAAPDESPASTTLALQSLGLGNTLQFYGLQGEVTISIPVPVGMRPAELTATVELPPNLLRGYLTVMQDDRSLVRMPLPANDMAPITIPLVGADVVNNAVTVRIRAYLVPPPDYCLYDPTNPLRLTDVGIGFTGTEAPPTVVADFLPPILQRLTIFVPNTPSLVESDSALRLTAAIAAHYGQQNPQITVAALPGRDAVAPPNPAGPFERQIVVREGPRAGALLQPSPGMPSLLITGPAGDITNQVRLLTSDVSRLAVSTEAVAGPLTANPQVPSDVTTIRDLGQPGVNATDLTNPRVSIPLDQTRLGRSVRGVRVHLQGTYTPLPSTLGGQILVSVAGQTITQWNTDATGRIDRWIDVPQVSINRYTSLDVEVQAAGNTGRCGEYAPIRLIIDGATSVESTLADPPVGLGFQSLPQALMPRVKVGLDGGDKAFADTVRAATIVEGLQRLSSRPLETTAVTFQQAVDSPDPAILIAADGWKQSTITLPVSAETSGPIKLAGSDGQGGDTTLTLDPAKPFGSLQTVYSGGRTVLVATSNGDANQLDSLLSWLDQSVRRWAQLDGNVVVAMPGRDPVTLNAEAPQPITEVRNDRPAALWWLVGGLLATAIAGFAVWAGTRHRKTAG